MIGKILCRFGSHRREVREFGYFVGIYCSRARCGQHLAGLTEADARKRIDELVGHRSGQELNSE